MHVFNLKSKVTGGGPLLVAFRSNEWNTNMETKNNFQTYPSVCKPRVKIKLACAEGRLWIMFLGAFEASVNISTLSNLFTLEVVFTYC